MPPLVALPDSDEDSLYRLGAGDPLELLLYRYDALIDLGVDALTATALSHVPDSHHAIEALVRAGCPVDVAAEILL